MTVAKPSNADSRFQAGEVPALPSRMRDALDNLVPLRSPTGAEQARVYAGRLRLEVTGVLDRIISMIDGNPYKPLHLHLSSNDMTPDEHRIRYDLRAHYPMVAEGHSHARLAIVYRISLGRQAGQQVERAPEAAAKAPNRGRKSNAAAQDAGRGVNEA